MLRRTATLFLLLCPAAVCAKEKPSPDSSEYQIGEVNTYGIPDQPMIALVKAVNAHPQRQRFHAWWGLAGTHGYSYDGELIYSKKQQILWIKFSKQEESDEVSDYSYISVWSQQWRFRRVTPERLRALYKRYAGKRYDDKDVSDETFEVSFFPRLTEFGCRGGLISRTSTRHRHKM